MKTIIMILLITNLFCPIYLNTNSAPNNFIKSEIELLVSSKDDSKEIQISTSNKENDKKSESKEIISQDFIHEHRYKIAVAMVFFLFGFFSRLVKKGKP